MSGEHEELRRDLGVYVLGALDPGRRWEVERHLAGCDACREELAELAVLPGLLNRLQGEPPLTDAGAPPAEPLLARIAAERRRWRRLARIGLAAAAVAVAVALVGLLLSVVAERSVAETFASGEGNVVAAVEARPWGMRVELEAGALPEARGYVLDAVAADGHRAQVATWRALDHPIRLDGACYLSPDEVDRLEVVAAGTDDVVAVLQRR